jgi:DNA-binding Xre family transcriptional regulator
LIKFDKLWVRLTECGLTKYKLHTYYGVSKAQIHRLQHNQSVSTYTIDRLCNLLNCEVDDIMEHMKDDNNFLREV